MFRSKATSYAILAASEIARQHQGPNSPGVQAADIAATYDLPTAYAAKIMSQLAKAQILRSDRGPRGGFQLARAPEKITLLEIFEAVRGVLEGGVMAGDQYVPDALQKSVTAALNKVTDQIRRRLAAVSLADLQKK